MAKVILRNKATKIETNPIEEEKWNQLKAQWGRVFEVARVIEIPPVVIAMRSGHYKEGKISYDIKPAN